jgi:hypothetical protein
MSESQFDPSLLLDATTSEASTRRPPIPAGTELIGIIEEINPRVVQGKKDPSKSYTFVDVKIRVSVPHELQAHGQPAEVVFVDGISLDTTAHGGFDMAPGKNGKLRRYRDSLDMNTPGVPFSLRNMIGRQIRVKIKHEAYEGEMYDRVDNVAKV